MKLLRSLQRETGQTFTYPETSTEASAEIGRMLAAKRSIAGEDRLEARQVRDDFAGTFGDAASVRAEELGGYGPSAHWRERG